MRVNLVKVCKASNARKLAFAYLSRSHGRRRRQKASAAATVFLDPNNQHHYFLYHLGSFPSFSKSEFLNIFVLSVFLATFHLLISPLN